MNKISLIIFSALFSFSPLLSATVISWGAGASGFSSDGGSSDGGLNAFLATTSGSGSYQSQSSVDGVSYTPVLKAAASNSYPANEDDTSVALAYAFQTFSYTDLISQNISLNLTLHGDVLNATDATLDSYLRGQVYVIGGSQLNVVDNSNPSNFQTCYNVGAFSAVYSAGFQSDFCGTTLASSNLWLFEGGTVVNDVLDFIVNPGDEFLIYAELKAVAFNGIADGFNTFTMNFSDPGSLVAASGGAVSVSEPPAFALLGLGLIGLLGFKHKVSIKL